MENNLESKRSKFKRIVIIIIYLVIFLFIISAIVYAVKPKPDCFDGKLNQNEQGIDCGGVCEKKCEIIAEDPIQVLEANFVPSGLSNKHDLYGYIYNPNSLFGSPEFSYKFSVKDASGKVIVEKSGKNFVLPGERKYLIETNLDILENPYSVELSIENVKWSEFNVGDYQKPDLKIVNKNYDKIVSGVGFSEVKGLLKNESQFDFASIDVYVILRSPEGKIIALNSTRMDVVKAGENRDFRVFWPSRFSGEVRTVETQTDVNVFKSEAFVKRYFNTKKFQEY